MARQGMLGEIVHAEGAYIHDLTKDWLFNKKAYADMWRLKENIGQNGNLYPTHGLGPIAQCMDINRGDKFEHLPLLPHPPGKWHQRSGPKMARPPKSGFWS